MCGIAGVFSYQSNSDLSLQTDLDRMQHVMENRGPDGVAYWLSDDGRVGLVHRRLSIIDLSHAADQPMISQDGRYVLVFNGEIYNYTFLSESLKKKGCVFRTHSDTEVILQLYAQEGASMLSKLRGMFAIAIWDNQENTLFLARDAFGIKPLYYAKIGAQFYFASQVKALIALPQMPKTLSAAGQVGFFLFGHVPEPYTLYENIKAFPAGCYAKIKAGEVIKPIVFCDLSHEIHAAKIQTVNEGERKEILREAMIDSVRAHLVADVPIAFFLSAGIDSSVLLALAKEQGYDTQALTLSFSEYAQSSLDEMPLAKRVAEQCQVPWHLKTVTEQDFLNAFPPILNAMDQPSIDGMNTYFVSQLAKEQGFKVAVSGLGADELLGGYAIYQRMPTLLNIAKKIRHLPMHWLTSFVGALGKKIGKEKLAGLTYLLKDEASLYLLIRGLYLPHETEALLDPDLFEKGLKELDLFNQLEQSYESIHTTHGRIQALEGAWYMRNQLLRDSDWAGMANSIEIRVPFVDLTLWRRVLTLGALANKALLFSLPINPLPLDILTRPKSGFNIPVAKWAKKLNKQVYDSNDMRNWSHFIYQEYSRGKL